MSRRRALMPSGRLPSGYIEVEYIESHGTENILTNVYLSDYTDYDLDCVVTSVSDWYTLIGQTLNLYRAWFLSTNRNNWSITMGLSGYNSSYIAIPKSRCQIKRRGRVLSVFIDETQYSTTTHSNTDYKNSNSQIIICTGYGKWHGVKLYQNSNIVGDFIPCINLSNEVGMYDLVSKTFFGNAGTGSFIAGDPV